MICISCGNSNVKIVKKGGQPLRLRGVDVFTPFEIRRCVQCGHLFNNKFLSDADTSALYIERGGNNTARSDTLSSSAKRVKETTKFLTKFLDLGLLSNNYPLLDFGGGVGQASNGLIPGKIIYVQDLAVVNPIGSNQFYINERQIKKDSYDFVVASHVFEHFWNPYEKLVQISSFLVSRGYIYIEVPVELHIPIIRKSLGDPCHVSYFSRRSLASMLNKCYFDVIACELDIAIYDSRKVPVIRALARKGNNRHLHDPQMKSRRLLSEVSYIIDLIFGLYIAISNRFKKNMYDDVVK